MAIAVSGASQNSLHCDLLLALQKGSQPFMALARQSHKSRHDACWHVTVLEAVCK